MLLVLNGPPGVGKSTVARLLVADRAGWLNCDIDIIRTLVGGWEDDFAAAGATIRPVAKAMISAHLAEGGVVVLPQLLGDADELASFGALADDAGTRCVHVLLDAADDVLVGRWRQRDAAIDPWAAASVRVLAGLGGDPVVLEAAQRVRAVAASTPIGVAGVISVAGQTPEETAEEVLRLADPLG